MGWARTTPVLPGQEKGKVQSALREKSRKFCYNRARPCPNLLPGSWGKHQGVGKRQYPRKRLLPSWQVEFRAFSSHRVWGLKGKSQTTPGQSLPERWECPRKKAGAGIELCKKFCTKEVGPKSLSQGGRGGGQGSAAASKATSGHRNI